MKNFRVQGAGAIKTKVTGRSQNMFGVWKKSLVCSIDFPADVAQLSTLRRYEVSFN
jgi:hypothetical protein